LVQLVLALVALHLLVLLDYLSNTVCWELEQALHQCTGTLRSAAMSKLLSHSLLQLLRYCHSPRLPQEELA
jgi:hypothetical protein